MAIEKSEKNKAWSKARWFTPFKQGIAACFVFCSVIATAAVYLSDMNASLSDKILSLKDAEIEGLKTKLSQLRDVSEKYQKEQLLRTQAEERAAAQDTRLTLLMSERWEEKYRAERIGHQAAKERLAVLQARCDGLAKQVEDGEVNPAKDSEITNLKAELEIVRKELQRVTELYTTSPVIDTTEPPPEPKSFARVKVVFTRDNESLAQQICSNLAVAGFQADATLYDNWVRAVRATLGDGSVPYLPQRAIFAGSYARDNLAEIQKAISPAVGGQKLETPAIDDENARAFGIGVNEALIVLR